MKKIFMILGLVTSLFGDSLNTYTIGLEQIKSIRYVSEETVVVELKEEYWEDFFKFTKNNVFKKVKLKLDNIVMTPDLFSPIYYTLELSPVHPESFSKELKLLLTKKAPKNTNELFKKKSIFLTKMLKKDTDNIYLREELIGLYHKQETAKASKECIEIYETTKEAIKSKVILNDYSKVFECYLDLNKTTEALAFLKFVKKETKENSLYEILEDEAYVYALLGELEKAKKRYVEAVSLLKRTDFLKEIRDPNKEIREQLEAMKKSDIERLNEIILDLEHKLSQKSNDENRSNSMK